MKHNKALDQQKFDRRLVNWNLKRGSISEQDLKNHMDSLEDCSSNSRNIEIDVEEESINEENLN